MLTKEEIGDTLEVCAELKERDQNFVTSPDYIEDLCRLALLGLEREESRARVEAAAEADTHVELSVLDDSFGAFPDLGLGPDLDLGPEPHEAFLTEERDRERAERVGRAVLADRELMRFAIETAIDTIRNGDGFEPDDVPKLRAIAAAMEEP